MGTEEQWGRRYMVEIKHLREVAKQEDDIKKRLKHFNIELFRENDKSLWLEEEKPLILKVCGTRNSCINLCITVESLISDPYGAGLRSEHKNVG